jgi:CheY-like chemotaxis protein
MQQLIMNLTINGAEAVGDGVGVVRISTGVRAVPDGETLADHPELGAGLYVCLEVSDNGCGMDESTQSRIFDPFFTTKMMGRGLGLSAVLGIVRGHHGAIKITSLPGGGSTFRVLLPASKTPAEKLRPAMAPAERGTGTVLVVDDEPAIRSLAQTALERLGYSVLVASNGREALDAMEEHPDIKVVLLDLTMPVLSGEATLQEMRKRFGAIPVVLCSGYNELESARRVSSSYVSSFLQKPFTPSQVASRITEAVAAGEPRRGQRSPLPEAQGPLPRTGFRETNGSLPRPGP